MEKFLKKTGYLSTITSIIFIMLAILVIINPTAIITIISYILGAIFIIIGGIKLADYISNRNKVSSYDYNLVFGIISIAIGIFTLAYSNEIVKLFSIIIGVWIIYSAILRFELSYKLRKVNLNIGYVSLVISIIMLIIGVYIILNPGIIIASIGIMMLIYAVMDLVESIIFLRNVKILN